MRFLKGMLRINHAMGYHWGFKAKLKHFQLNEIEPFEFIHMLSESGWLILHCVRKDQVRRGLSTWVAGLRGNHHDFSTKKVYIPPNGAVSAMREALATLESENEVLRRVEHHRLLLEVDLVDHAISNTMTTIQEALNVRPHRHESKFGNINGISIFDAIENAEEVREMLMRHELIDFTYPESVFGSV